MSSDQHNTAREIRTQAIERAKEYYWEHAKDHLPPEHWAWLPASADRRPSSPWQKSLFLRPSCRMTKG